MFKKSRNHKILANPPTSPTFEEILEDMKTFHIDIEPSSNCKPPPPPDANSVSLEAWWYTFEQFINDLKCLKMLKSEIADYKLKLEDHQLEINTEAKVLKNEIEDQQQQHINSVSD